MSLTPLFAAPVVCMIEPVTVTPESVLPLVSEPFMVTLPSIELAYRVMLPLASFSTRPASFHSMRPFVVVIVEPVTWLAFTVPTRVTLPVAESAASVLVPEAFFRTIPASLMVSLPFAVL
ncbi:hypothetical protein BLIC_b01725 [Bifidobacterium longum subsp. infantis]|uniref:Uncharacterized protein n=1 Tax=Bifidobacterium longum subsp. infantis TaxID=1682 RepID=A0ABP1XB66_BIFLI|nr:hypothetical protein BLIC_a01715 [Bifidobacterium longum subsp. infantis]CEF01931.1 hypothetical protein BLIC_b01725 [Bifidobacterium longum subsp. infantis]CEF03143.1 hypothetical protein BLIC_c01720 [Bifidobacterium longum subsp. infantis]CEF07972.1 hypothetical protein BLIC_e01738 [Bifidobacterium longum subsp. infantis]CEF10549.1 hypothetical protein BLIC_g01710 [Bifidobacterium longum subsp. infantis]